MAVLSPMPEIPGGVNGQQRIVWHVGDAAGGLRLVQFLGEVGAEHGCVE